MTGDTVIQCDFDGTLVTANISEAIVEAYAPPNWKGIVQEYHRGLLSVEEQNRRLFRLITQDRDTLVRFSLELAQLRNGFHPFLDYCRTRNISIVVVSNGFDFYIEAIMRKFALGHLQYICGRAEFSSEGIIIHYPSPEGGEAREDFKLAHLKALKKRASQAIYIGDGVSDFLPASQAEYVFARGSLQRRCQSRGLPCQPFEDFHDVLAGLKRLGF